jgi:hypothetical protein
MFPLSLGWSSFAHHNYIAKLLLHLLFNMVQIKLSAVFILVAAAIIPVVALPTVIPYASKIKKINPVPNWNHDKEGNPKPTFM